ncbi:MAG: glycosyltransferase family 2 protein [Acidobacteriaceae bacterium]|nr:glycosyltransferase family 2 protein [Acidobacteriaceae bacterium]
MTSVSPEGRICAVVVTFNRVNLLRKCLHALLVQTRPLDHILIVNNKSTDNTAQMLASEFPQLEVMHMAENTGGSGGFAAGMKEAHARGFDWLWIMDDDVEAYPTALASLLDYRDISDYLHMRKDLADGNWHFEGLWDFHVLTVRMLPTEVSFANGKEWMVVNYSNFEGPLIHRRVIDKIGLPDARYFMYGDDVIYGLQASFHTNPIYINRTGFRKDFGWSKGMDRMSYYFTFRNNFLTQEHLRAIGLYINNTSFWISNVRNLIWCTHHILTTPGQRKWNHATAVWQGLRDGIRRNYHPYGRPPWMC